jgi:histone H3/H4
MEPGEEVLEEALKTAKKPTTKSPKKTEASKVPPKKSPPKKIKKPSTHIVAVEEEEEEEEAPKHVRKQKQSTKTNAQIRTLQNSAKQLTLAKAPTERLVRILVARHGGPEFRLTKDAVLAACYAGEAYTLKVWMKVNELAKHAGRSTIMCKDFDRSYRLCTDILQPAAADILSQQDKKPVVESE